MLVNQKVGITRHDDRLDDLSLDAFLKRKEYSQNLLERIKKIEPSLTHHEDVINMEVLKAELLTYIEGYDYKG